MPQVFDPAQFTVTQGFGANGEVGVDVGLRSGTPVYAPYAGTATVVDFGASRTGLTVYTKLPGGGFDYIGHLRAASVNSGDPIQPGQLLGYSGGGLGDPSHGNTTGSHIEFALGDAAGRFSDPLPTLRALESSSAAPGAGGTITVGFPGVPGFVTQPGPIYTPPGAPGDIGAIPGNIAGIPGSIADAITSLPGKVLTAITDSMASALSGFGTVLGHGLANLIRVGAINFGALVRSHIVSFAVAGVILAVLFLR